MPDFELLLKALIICALVVCLFYPIYLRMKVRKVAPTRKRR